MPSTACPNIGAFSTQDYELFRGDARKRDHWPVHVGLTESRFGSTAGYVGTLSAPCHDGFSTGQPFHPERHQICSLTLAES